MFGLWWGWISVLASQCCTLGKKTPEGWIKVEHITERKSTIYKGEQLNQWILMVNKPVISHFHSFIMSENLLELKCNRRVQHTVLNAQNQRGSFLPWTWYCLLINMLTVPILLAFCQKILWTASVKTELMNRQCSVRQQLSSCIYLKISQCSGDTLFECKKLH